MYICCSHLRCHIWASPRRVLYIYSLTKDLRMFCKVILNSDVKKRRHKKCQSVSCRAENRAALWLEKSKPLHFPVLVVQNPVLLRNRALSSTEASGKFSRSWLE